VQLVGITQEQHPERCRLFAQWKEMEWPILWDPFNLTGSQAVPNFTAIDELGVVRIQRPDPAAFHDEFLTAEFSPVEAERPVIEVSGDLRDLMSREPDKLGPALAKLEARALEAPQSGALQFQLGVGYRMRFDSERAEPGDFQAALDAWGRALEIDPNQYIWRRRIQQFGPRLDKPYPFYGWIAEAREAIRARGAEPQELVAGLTGSELASPGREAPRAEDPVQPDAKGRIRRDEGEFALVDIAVALDTQGREGVARVHLAFRPNHLNKAHWNNEAGPMRVWLGEAELPPGVSVDRRLLVISGPAEAVSSERREVDFEVQLSGARPGASLTGYALFYACEDVDGICVYRRRDFEIALP